MLYCIIFLTTLSLWYVRGKSFMSYYVASLLSNWAMTKASNFLERKRWWRKFISNFQSGLEVQSEQLKWRRTNKANWSHFQNLPTQIFQSHKSSSPFYTDNMWSLEILTYTSWLFILESLFFPFFLLKKNAKFNNINRLRPNLGIGFSALCVHHCSHHHSLLMQSAVSLNGYYKTLTRKKEVVTIFFFFFIT